jgi:hypothetical protein
MHVLHHLYTAIHNLQHDDINQTRHTYVTTTVDNINGSLLQPGHSNAQHPVRQCMHLIIQAKVQQDIHSCSLARQVVDVWHLNSFRHTCRVPKHSEVKVQLPIKRGPDGRCPPEAMLLALCTHAVGAGQLWSGASS